MFEMQPAQQIKHQLSTTKHEHKFTTTKDQTQMMMTVILWVRYNYYDRPIHITINKYEYEYKSRVGGVMADWLACLTRV